MNTYLFDLKECEQELLHVASVLHPASVPCTHCSERRGIYEKTTSVLNSVRDLIIDEERREANKLASQANLAGRSA